MSDFSEVRTALGKIVGDVPAFLAVDGQTKTVEGTEGRKVVIKSDWSARAFQVSYGNEEYEVAVDTDRPAAPIIHVLDAQCEHASHEQVRDLQRALTTLGLPGHRLKLIDPACLTYTVQEAARILGFPRSTMYDAIGRNEVPVVRIGRSMRVPRQFIDEQLASRKAAT